MTAPGSRYVIGAGMSGLGAGLGLKAPVFEAESRPGGICHSVYYDETGARREPLADDVSTCFRFEPAGGHFLLSPDAKILDLLFLPVGWWHWVRALDVSISATFSSFREPERNTALRLPRDILGQQ
jgi:phytoene dehydrogenase-like protein